MPRAAKARTSSPRPQNVSPRSRPASTRSTNSRPHNRNSGFVIGGSRAAYDLRMIAALLFAASQVEAAESAAEPLAPIPPGTPNAQPETIGNEGKRHSFSSPTRWYHLSGSNRGPLDPQSSA